MKLSFGDEDTFKESVGSLNFNNPPSDSDSFQGVGSSGSMPPGPQERNEDICCHGDHNPPSDPNIILEVRRVPVGSSSGSGGSTPPSGEE